MTDGSTCTELPAVNFGASTIVGKTLLGSHRVSIGLPAATAGIVSALVLDESHHIFQRITEEYANFVRKVLLQAEAAG